jgi:TolA-binding protein
VIPEVFYWLGDANYHMGLHARAAGYYNTAIERSRDPEERQAAMYGLAWSRFKAGNFGDAAEIFRELSDRFPDSPYAEDSKFRIGDCHFNLKNYERAFEAYQDFKADYPTSSHSTRATYQMGSALYRLGSYSTMRELLTDLAESRDESVGDRAQYLIGWSHFREGDFDRATLQFERMKEMYPGSDLLSKTQYSIGDCHYNQEQYRKAIEAYRAVIEEYPESEELDDAITAIEQSYRQLGMETDAIEFLKSLKPSASVQIRIGDVYFNLGRFNEAAEEYEKVIDSFPGSQSLPTALYKIGLSYMELGEYALASDHLLRLVRDAPSSELVDDAKLKIGEIYVENGEYGRAISHLEKYRSNSPLNLSRSLLFLSVAYVQSGEIYKAKETLLSITEKYPDEPASDRANLELGKIYLREEGYSVALSRFRDVIRSRTDEVACEAQFFIGELHFKKGEFETALTEYERVEHIYGFCTKWIPKALLGAGSTYEKLERYDEAKEVYKKIVRGFSTSQESAEAESRLDRIKWK